MGSKPTVLAQVTVLLPSEGGRRLDAVDSPLYRPHIVIGDPDQRIVLVDRNGNGTEDYLGVQFVGDDRVLQSGIAHQVTLSLMYFPEVDYSAVTADATFTIREGSQVVGFGKILTAPTGLDEVSR